MPVPPLATAVTVPPRLHPDVMLTVSAAAGETVTVKLRAAPDTCGELILENATVELADAGATATNARPASMRADVAPMATNDFIRVLKERWPTLGFAEFIIGFPPLHFPSGLNA